MNQTQYSVAREGDTSIIIDATTTTIVDTEHAQLNRSVTITVNPYAILTYFFTPQMHSTTILSFIIHEHAQVHVYSVVHNWAIMHVSLSLVGNGACASFNGLYMLGDAQSFVLTTNQIHSAFDCTSKVFIKGMAQKKASVDFKGTITLEKNAVRSNADQQHVTILLDDDAVVQSTPTLQVLTDDVACSHGTAIGQLDSEHMFYAQSRGLHETQAQYLLLEGHCAQILVDLPIDMVDSVKKRLYDYCKK